MANFKKSITYIIIFIIIIYIIPALCTKKSVSTLSTIKSENLNKDEVEKYNYSQFSKIKLLHKAQDSVEELPIDEYLYGVVAAEMPATFEIEALRAQAVAARTYTIFKIKNTKKHNEKNADICDDSTCCQAWISKEDRLKKWDENSKEANWEKITQAVNSTAGKIITYKNEPINAFFHSNSGGITESVSNVWGEKDIPYLKSVETSGEDGYLQYSSEVTLTRDELLEKLKRHYSDITINFNEADCIKVLEYTDSKRVKTVKFGNTKISGTETRSLLDLKSTNFKIKIDENNIVFSVIGYGHGVGMSQTGADSMAKSGYKYEEILKHFYTDTEISVIGDVSF